MDLVLKNYEVVEEKTRKVARVVESVSVKSAASLLDRAAQQDLEDKNWRRRFIIRPVTPNAFVIDNVAHDWGLEYIKPNFLPERAQQRSYNGKLYWHIIRNGDKGTEGRLDPYLRPEKIDVTPQKVYRAMKIKDLIVLWVILNAQKNAKLIIGMLVAVILVTLAILYFASQGN